MKYYSISIICFAVLFLFSSCDSHTERKIVDRCIEAHGGMDAWNNLDTILYRKQIILYEQDGSIEKQMQQTHAYIYEPEFYGLIVSENDTTVTETVLKNGILSSTVNGITQHETPNPFKSAVYVLNMPWKLNDNNAKLTKEDDTVIEGKAVHTIRVDYPSIPQSDTWWYYINSNDYSLVANKVKHGTTYSLIINDNYKMYYGLLFNHQRTSYRVDSLNTKLYKRAEYIYLF